MTKKKENEPVTVPDNSQSDFGPDDMTPAGAQIRMPEEAYYSIKIIVVKKRMMMREFYAEAFEALVKKREAWDEKEDGYFIYRSPLIDGKLVSIAVFQHQVEDIDRMAAEDGQRPTVAYYTAIMEHIERLSKEIDI